MPSVDKIFNQQYADSLVDNNKMSDYVNYLKQVRSQVDNPRDYNQLSVDIASIENDLNVEKARLAGKSDDYIGAYNLVKAIENGESLTTDDKGYAMWENYRTEVDKLGSILDDNGNISRRASKLMFTFDSDYDYNSFLDNTGYNESVLTKNGIEVGNKEGKHYVTVDKANPMFSTLLQGVNSTDDWAQEAGFWDSVIRDASIPIKRFNREVSQADGVFNKIGAAIKGVVVNGILGIGTSMRPMPRVIMTGIDENGVLMNTTATKADDTSINSYRALGDRALSDYKRAKDIISDDDTNDEYKLSNIHLLGYASVAQSEAMDYLDATGDEKWYKAFMGEENHRFDMYMLSEPLSNYDIMIDDDASGVVRPAQYDEVGQIQRLLRNAISEGGTSNDEEKARRVTYQTGYTDDGELGMYITIADKSDKNKLTDDFDYDNTLPGRTIFVKGMLDEVTQGAIERDTSNKAARTVAQMLKLHYDYHFTDGSKLINPTNDGAEYVSADGLIKQRVGRADMWSLLNEEYATQNAIGYMTMQQNVAETSRFLENIKSEQNTKLFNLANKIVSDSYPNMNPADKLTRANELYLRLCTNLNIKPE